MKDLIEAIRERLSDQLTYLPMKDGSKRAVYITTDGLPPKITDFPAIALKDGPEDFTVEGGTMVDSAEFEKTMMVHVTAFVQLYREEELLTGDGSAKGILEVAEDILTALLLWLPSSVYVIALIVDNIDESQIHGAEEGETVYIQSKTLTFITKKQVTAQATT